MFSPQLIQEFKIAVQKDYGIDLNDKNAAEILETLTKYFDLLAKIHHREKKAVESPDLSLKKS